MDITNGSTKIKLADNGAIKGIVDNESGHVYFDACEADQRLFHLIVPSETWSSRSISTQNCNLPEVIEDTEGLKLRYSDLELEGQPSGISAEVSFKTSGDTNEIQISLKLVNNGNETITGAIFPWINGWQNSDDLSLDQVVLGPTVKKPINELPHSCCAWGNGTLGQEWTIDYPTHTMLPWADISGENSGVSFINYQRKPRQCFVSAKNMAGHEPGYRIGLLWGFYAYVPPGSEWESPVIGISVHKGDWHQTADRYRKWAGNWFTPAPSKREFRESIGSEHVFFSYFDGTPFRPYETMPEIAATERKYGIRELCVWDRLSLGIYGSRYLPDEDLLKYNPDDREAISRAIKEAVDGGSDVSALVNFRLLNTRLNVFEEQGLEEEVQKAYDGSTKMEIYSGGYIPGRFFTPHLGPYCNLLSPFSEKYRQRSLEQIERYLDLGYTSLFYDQPFESAPDYSRKDNGCIPEMTYKATLDLIRNVREKLREKNPEAVIMGEQCDIYGSEVIDQWMTWAWSNIDIESAIRTHYSLPQTVINCVIDSDIGLASHAFAAGLHLFLMTKAGTGTLADVPEFAEHVRKLAELRKRFADRTVHARFCDQLGLTIDTDDDIVAYSYESDAGPAVIVAAPEKDGKVVIDLNRESFTHPGAEQGKVIRLNGNESETTGDHQEFELKKDEVLVWIT